MSARIVTVLFESNGLSQADAEAIVQAALDSGAETVHESVWADHEICAQVIGRDE